jgi:hypothetical protein
MGHKCPGTSVTEVRIVEAAAQLFAHNGFKGTTTRDIAQLPRCFAIFRASRSCSGLR